MILSHECKYDTFFSTLIVHWFFMLYCYYILYNYKQFHDRFAE